MANINAYKRLKEKSPLGEGGRFAALKSELAAKKGTTKKGKSRKVTNPGALAAYIGRKKYGNKRFQEMAAAGKKG
jgi:hypothetical protein